MSKLLGGLFSRPSGKTSGIVFGAGRTIRGKQVTSREYVIPTDPRTNAQLEQRSKMPFSTSIIQSIGRSIYQFDWNRAVNNLPGFQSLSSLFMRFIDFTTGILNTPSAVSLGARHFPDTWAAAAGTDQIDVTWSTENGDIGSADDTAIVIAVATNPDSGEVTRSVVVDDTNIRSDGAATIPATGVAAGDYQVLLYFRSEESGVPTNDKRSSARWLENT